MRSAIIAICVLAQASVLGFMVYGREAVISAGTSISIATAPIDPRDPFRGDFVRLRYGLNSLAYAPARWVPEDIRPRKGDRVYAVLKERPGGMHDVDYFTNVEPGDTPDTLFIRGRLRRNNAGTGLNQVDVGYGIEQLFVEQGRGIGIEERQGVRGGIQTAMHARVSVDADGTAVLTGHTWSPLAIGIEISANFALNRNTDTDTDTDTETESESDTASRSPLVLTIVNQSNDDITLNNPGDNCGFHLEPMNRVTSRYSEPVGICADLPAEPRTLLPGESLVIPVDLADPRWQMSLPLNGEIRTADIRSYVDNGEWFRLAYRSETATGDRTDGEIVDAAGFWQGELVSQAFNALGQVD